MSYLYTETPFFMTNYNVEIGIVETRKIISAILEHYNLDYKDYALTFLKHRLERIINGYNLKNAEVLIEKITTDKAFFEQFLQDITVEDTEMFRDPSLWRLMRDEFFPKQLQNLQQKFKIWMVGMQSGEELYSMAILLTESNLWDKVEITASYESTKNFELIKNGIFNTKKIELNDANYKRFNCYSELTRYYTINGNNNGYWDKSLINNIQFIKHNIAFDNSLKNFNLVWFRNGMIYFNQVLQDKVLNTLYDSLVQYGFLIIGDKETVEYSSFNKKFKQIEETEKIYKKL